MRGLFWAGTGIIALLAAVFAASNRQDVELGFWPLPDLLPLPLYLVVLLALGAGFLAGRLTGWAMHQPVRSERRQQKRRIETLEAELSRARAVPPASPAPPGRALVPRSNAGDRTLTGNRTPTGNHTLTV